MDLARYLVRAELRRRWVPVILLGLLVTIVTATVLASTAGARHTRTAFDRYLAGYGGIDLLVGEGEDPVPLDEIASLAGVEDAIGFTWYAAFPDDGAGGFYPTLVPADDRVPREYLRPPLVEGRAPDPAEPLEVALGETSARRLGVGVGDEVPLMAFSPSDMDGFGESQDIPPATGPDLALSVVGIVRGPTDLAGGETDIDWTLLTPAFGETFGDDLGVFSDGVMVAVAPGASVEDVGSAIAGLADVQIDGFLGAAALKQQINPTLGWMAGALYLVAFVVTVVGAVAIAQAAARNAGDAAQDAPALGALGVASGTQVARVVAPGLVAVGAGVAVGAALSVALSPLVITGIAERAEPSSGAVLDPLVLVLGSVTLAVLLGGVVTATSWWVLRRLRRDSATPRPSAIAAASTGLPVPVASGIRFAFDAGRGGRATPVRTAVVATATAVAGVLAAVMVATSIHHATVTPAIYGAGWDALLGGIEGGDNINDGEVDIDGMATDAAFTAVAEVTDDLEVTVAGTPQSAVAIDDRRGHTPFVVVHGREPQGASEVALGANTLRRLGLSIGESVAVSAGGPDQPMEVVGVVALPVSVDGGSNAEGVALRREAADAAGFDGVCDGDEVACSRNYAITAPAGTDLERAVAPYLGAEPTVGIELPSTPADVDRLSAVQAVPRILAGVLALIGILAISYVALVTVRRRRHDLALLRVLGFTGRQVRTTVAVQLGVLAAVGTAVGVAGGLLVANLAWRAIADDVAIPAVVVRPALVLVVVPLAAVVLGFVLSVAPGRRAAQISPAIELRSVG